MALGSLVRLAIVLPTEGGADLQVFSFMTSFTQRSETSFTLPPERSEGGSKSAVSEEGKDGLGNERYWGATGGWPTLSPSVGEAWELVKGSIAAVEMLGPHLPPSAPLFFCFAAKGEIQGPRGGAGL